MFLWFLIFYLFQLTFFLVYGNIYEGYKVFKVTPKSQYEVNILGNLSHEFKLDTWTSSRIPDSQWVMSVKPDQVNDFENILHEKQFQYAVINSNLGHTFRKEKLINTYKEKKDALFYNFRKVRSTKSTRRKQRYIKMDRFYSYKAIVSYMEAMENQYPSTVSTFTIGETTTFQGNSIKGIHITNGDGGDKPIIFIEGGIHAREWISPAMSLYLMIQLIDNDNYKYMLEKFDWFIIPVVNPDGYEYSMTYDRMWRKNRSPGKYCTGVDLNRNWDFHWGEGSERSKNECVQNYCGTHAFSEVETKAYAKFASQYKDSIKLYISFHSHGSMVLYPWGYTSKYPANVHELHTLGNAVANAITRVRGTKYKVGSIPDLLYRASGNSLDWMKGVAGIPLTFSIELPGAGHGFDPPASKIKGIVEETFEGVKVLHNYVQSKYPY